MPTGKLAAQAGHAYTDALCHALETDPDRFRSYRRDDVGGSKVTLLVKNENALRRAYEEAIAAGLPAVLITDRDHVLPPHFDGSPIVTALGIGPCRKDECRHITKKFRTVGGEATRTKIYTLIAYRPDGYDGCAGRMSPADLKTEFFTSTEDLVSRAARLEIENEQDRRKDHGCSPLELKILIDGVDEESWWSFHERTDEYSEADEDHFSFWEMNEAIMAETERLRAEMQTRAERAAAEAKRLAAERAAQQEAQRLAQKEVEEQEMLRSLIEKHGIPADLSKKEG